MQGAEAVCSADLPTLTRLVDSSLVIVDEQRGRARHRFLEVIRQYAADRLAALPDAAATAERHARFYADLAQRSAPALTGHDPERSMALLGADHDNLRAALIWYADNAPDEALRMAAALWWFWFRVGAWREGRRWLERVLSGTGGPASPARARVLLGLGTLAWAQGDHPLATASLEECIVLSRRFGEHHDLGLALQFLSMEVLGQGDTAEALRTVTEGVAELRLVADEQPVALALALASQGVAEVAAGDLAAARASLVESIALMRTAKDSWAVALPLRNLGVVGFVSGELASAAAVVRESLETLRDHRDPWFVSRSLETLAVITSAQGHHARAARLFGAGETMRATVGAAVLQFYRTDYDRALAATRKALGDAAFSHALRAGRALRIDEAMAFALADAEAPSYGLSPRENEVLQLLARGLSNRAIAEQLVITEKTAEAHVSAVLRKLNLTSRAQVAAWVAGQQSGAESGVPRMA